MKVLWTVPSYTPFVGGAQTLVAELAERSIDQGENRILTTNALEAADFWRPGLGNRLPARESINGVEIERLALRYPPPAPYRFALLRRLGLWTHACPIPEPILIGWLRQFARSMPPLDGLQSALRRLSVRVDAIVSVDAGWDGLLLAAAECAAERRIDHFIIPLIHTGSPAIGAGYRMAHQRQVYRQAEGVLALSKREASLLGEMGVSQNRISLLFPGVNPAAGKRAGSADHFRERHRLRGPVVAFVGATTFDKGAFTLLDSLPELNRRFPVLSLVFAGPERARLVDYVGSMEESVRSVIQERARFLGLVDETTKQTLLSASDLLVLASRVDSFGIVVLEAALHAKPTIAAAAGGLAETVRHGETGLLIPFDDSSALVTAISRLIDEPALAQRLGRRAQQRTIADYTWTKTYERFREIISA